MNSPISRYLEDLEKPDFRKDPAQRLAVDNLQRLFEELLAYQPEQKSWLASIFNKQPAPQTIKGLYFWGGVGRGKTYLMDTFYHCLPFQEKKRYHFHVFMQEVHELIKGYRDKKDPLVHVAREMGQNVRVLCFDEFVVNDVADAVILSKLMEQLYSMGVILVATSNVEPKHLYKNGLQRDLFIPAIKSIYTNTDVLNIDGGTDYRLEFLNKADIYFTPLNEASEKGLATNFAQLSPDDGKPNHPIFVLGREVQTVHWADGICWFWFKELCETARSQNDYIEIARRFHSIILQGVPQLDSLKADSARRLINLVDVFYEHNIKLIISAAVTVEDLYIGNNPQVKFEFERTKSRLFEMQSKEYLSKPHIC